MAARLTVGPISAAEQLAFIRDQPAVSFLQTPAWGDVKTDWRFTTRSAGTTAGGWSAPHSS